MKPSAGYLIPITSIEALRSSLPVQTQTLDQISRSSAESLNPQPTVLDARSHICNPDISQDVVICHGKKDMKT